MAPDQGQAELDASGPEIFSIDDISRVSADLPAFVVSSQDDETKSDAFTGRILSREVQPGLFVSARDVTFLRDGQLSIDAQGCVSCGILLEGHCSPIEVDGHPPLLFSNERAILSGNDRAVRSTCRWTANERHVFTGFLLEATFFERFGEDIADDGLKLLREFCSSSYQAVTLPFSRRLSEYGRATFTLGYGPQLGALFLEANTLAFTIEVAKSLHASRRVCSAIGRKQYERVMTACDLLNADLANTPTTLALARQVGVNVATLQAHFKATFGVGIFGYIRRQRLELARELVQDTELPISEIGRRVGFSSPSAFSTAYRQYHGESPMRRTKRRID